MVPVDRQHQQSFSSSRLILTQAKSQTSYIQQNLHLTNAHILCNERQSPPQ